MALELKYHWSHDENPHFLTVCAWLDQHFPRCWLGQRGPHERPPRGPDLTPCDFLSPVKRTKPRTVKDSKPRIQEVLCNIPNGFLQKTGPSTLSAPVVLYMADAALRTQLRDFVQ